MTLLQQRVTRLQQQCDRCNWSQETNNEVLVPHLPEQQDNIDEGHGTAV